MQVYLHADDFGLTRKITDDILECIDAGVINSVSIMANGYAFDYAAEELIKRKDKNINLVLHLNLDQGPAFTQTRFLADENGQLNKGFEGIFWRSMLLSASQKKQLKQEINKELEKQILKAVPLFEVLELPLKTDGERCTHLVPIVFDALMELNEKYPMTTVRLVREPFRFIFSLYPETLFSMGMIKWIAMKVFSVFGRYEEKLRSRNIGYADLAFSLVRSGQLTHKFIKKVMSNIDPDRPLEIEVVFHPFRPAEEELPIWSERYIYKSRLNADIQGREKDELLKHRDYFASLNSPRIAEAELILQAE